MDDLYWGPLFEKSPIPIVIYEADGLALLAANRAMSRVYGFSPVELLDMTAREIGFPDHGSGLAHESLNQPQRHRRKDGSTVYVEVTAQPIHFKGRPAWMAHIVDVSEKRELEARFLRGQRLECIGMLASGVAHDLNNVLSPIMMSASMLHEKLPRASVGEFVSVIEQSAQRGVKLLRQVLTFVKGVEGEYTVLKLEPVIDEVTEMARQTFPKTIEIQCDLPAKGLWEIQGDATKIHQVILNLAVNARDAMEEGGVLRISARNCEIEPARLPRFGNSKAGRYVAVAIHDTGIGMPEEVRCKLFTPFFTTKAPGKGTGLGLVTVLGIIKSHGGGIDIESIPQRGSTFTLYFPASNVSEQVPKEVESVRISGIGKRILVVDDEPGIRQLVKAILGREGYEVLTAASGTEAMAEYVRNPGAIKLVLVDLIMPSMDGVVLSRAIKSLDPDALIVATSGAESDSRLQELRSLGVTRFLKKPYQAPELLAAVSAALV
jgi:PAS domain S-box-containing protein